MTSSQIDKRQKMERSIARKFIRTALDAGYAISVWNGGDEPEISKSTKLKPIMEAMFATDEEKLVLHKDGERQGWVHFVYGNDGYDVIADYVTTLEHLMGPVNQLSDKYQDRL